MCKYLVALFSIVLLPVHGCTESANERKAVFESLPEIRNIRPEKPVKIKLKRNASGKYTWELNGDNAEKVIEADVKLRKALAVN